MPSIRLTTPQNSNSRPINHPVITHAMIPRQHASTLPHPSTSAIVPPRSLLPCIWDERAYLARQKEHASARTARPRANKIPPLGRSGDGEEPFSALLLQTTSSCFNGYTTVERRAVETIHASFTELHSALGAALRLLERRKGRVGQELVNVHGEVEISASPS